MSAIAIQRCDCGHVQSAHSRAANECLRSGCFCPLYMESTRPDVPAEPSVLAGPSVEVPTVEKPALTAPDEMSHVVEEGHSPVAPSHSYLEQMQEIGRVMGYAEACAEIFAVLDDQRIRDQVIALLSEKAPALLQKLIGDIRVSIPPMETWKNERG